MVFHQSIRATLFLLALVPSAALAIASTASLGADVAYRYDFEGWFWDAQHVERHRTITLTRVDAVLRPRAEPAKPDTARADGEVVATATSLLAHAPERLVREAHWTTSLQLGVGENGDDRIDVPVEVRVTAVQEGGVTLQASGAASGHATGGGYRNPVEVRVRLAAHLTAATIDQLREAVEEDVHAGPYSQTMRWQWTLTAAPR